MVSDWFATLTFGKVILIVFTLLAAYMFVKLSLMDLGGIRIFNLWQKVLAAIMFPLILVAVVFFSSLYILGIAGFFVLTVITLIFWILIGRVKVKKL